MTAFSRTRLLLGHEAVEHLALCHVCVFGVGGVGGYVAEALARTGIGALTLVDADVVDESNLNRQIIALRSTIGQPKVEVCAARIADINPACRVTPLQLFYLPENAAAVNLQAFSFVADCIDTVAAKVEIARRCAALGVPLVSCMGAGGKLDPMGFRVSDIAKTHTDPLAKVMRRKLRDLDIPHLTCVWSPELPIRPKTVANAEPAATKTPPPSCAFTPAAAGLLIASHIVRSLIGETR